MSLFFFLIPKTQNSLPGTLLFAVVFFLFPTLAAYYFFFSVVRLLITVVHATLFLTVFFFNSFPFYDFIAYLMDPYAGKLPGGVWFEVLPDPQPAVTPPSPSPPPSLSPRIPIPITVHMVIVALLLMAQMACNFVHVCIHACMLCVHT
jgi:hypothetical protein